MTTIFRPGLFDGHVALITGGGSGIGLTVVQEIARQHAGSARLGEAGGGAQFVVELAGQGA